MSDYDYTYDYVTDEGEGSDDSTMNGGNDASNDDKKPIVEQQEKPKRADKSTKNDTKSTPKATPKAMPKLPAEIKPIIKKSSAAPAPKEKSKPAVIPPLRAMKERSAEGTERTNRTTSTERNERTAIPPPAPQVEEKVLDVTYNPAYLSKNNQKAQGIPPLIKPSQTRKVADYQEQKETVNNSSQKIEEPRVENKNTPIASTSKESNGGKGVESGSGANATSAQSNPADNDDYYSDYYTYSGSYGDYSDEYYDDEAVDFEKLASDLIASNYNLETLKNIYSECVKQRPLSEMTKDQKMFLDVLYGEIEKKKKNKK